MNYDFTKGYRIYYNLHKHVFSVQAYCTDLTANGNKRGWILYKHSPAIIAKDVTFKISETGRQRVISEKAKNVHAFVCAKEIRCIANEEVTLSRSGVPTISMHDTMLQGLPHQCTYNPYKVGYFYDKETNERVDAISLALLTNKQIRYVREFVK